LEHINLSSTITEVGQSAFCGCDSLKAVLLSTTLKIIGRAAFGTCSLLERITIPSTVTEISVNAFYNCRRLREVELHEGIQTIGTGAFEECSSLQCITIPHTVTEIGRRAFDDCGNLREVDLHEGIQMIASTAFDNCSSLERFNFPNLSSRLDAIIQAGKYVDVENKIDEVRGIVVERRGNELFVSDVESVTQRLRALKGTLGQIDRLITYYEAREATTLLELAIWKSKIDQAEVKPPINRDAHRIGIPGPVKDIILQYLNFRV